MKKTCLLFAQKNQKQAVFQELQLSQLKPGLILLHELSIIQKDNNMNNVINSLLELPAFDPGVK